MGESKQIEAESRGYGAWAEEENEWPEDEPWPSEQEMKTDADNER